MSYTPKLTAQERQRAAHQQVEASKKPYIAKGMPRTILFLTEEQAAKRSDLIPQFGRLPLEQS
ncbi:hypothetical protein GO755_38760 [Spirosoma sp. HMF4905]|uniref:Uncharacterized protein n=1 Tax=Spirosoma arboris TaxID=2682092 RepID=A0A7K1SQE6_9BACT|nr:hypothetical protein [Spirosoma arboris]MVM36019.1 hypothetical protein [Spirosoma arboris]